MIASRCQERRPLYSTKLRQLLTGVALAAASLTQAANDELNPGLYVVTSSADATAQHSSSTSEQRACLSSTPDAGVDKLAARYDITDCKTTKSSATAGRILLQVQCGTDDRRLTLNGNGTFTDDSYSMTSDVAIKLESTSLRLTTRTSGKRVGDC